MKLILNKGLRIIRCQGFDILKNAVTRVADHVAEIVVKACKDELEIVGSEPDPVAEKPASAVEQEKPAQSQQVKNAYRSK